MHVVQFTGKRVKIIDLNGLSMCPLIKQESDLFAYSYLNFDSLITRFLYSLNTWVTCSHSTTAKKIIKKSEMFYGPKYKSIFVGDLFSFPATFVPTRENFRTLSKINTGRPKSFVNNYNT